MPNEVRQGKNCLLKTGHGGTSMEHVMIMKALSGVVSTYKAPYTPNLTPTIWKPATGPTGGPTTHSAVEAKPTSPVTTRNPNS